MSKFMPGIMHTILILISRMGHWAGRTATMEQLPSGCRTRDNDAGFHRIEVKAEVLRGHCMYLCSLRKENFIDAR